MKYLIFVLAFTSAALAQEPKKEWIVQNVREQYDESTDLGKAMNICAQHRSVSPNYRGQKSGIPVVYADGWESCNDVHAKWEQSQEAQDKAFIKKVGQ